MKTLSFSNNDKMPMVGLGTWKAGPGEVYNAVKMAIEIGYRHIDCAFIYGNENEIGQAIADSLKDGIAKREDLWITSKLWNNSHHPDDVKPALDKTLQDLQLDYLDLFLLHWPVALKKDVLFPQSSGDLIPIDSIPIEKTWSAMEQLVQAGKCNHIGVCNFSVHKLKNLHSQADLKPEMNQIELHPYLQQKELVKFCAQNDIHVTAYSPLGSPDRPERLRVENEPIILEDAAIGEIAERHGSTPGQVLISWAINRGTSVIPKSVNRGRLKQNLEAPDVSLSAHDMSLIEALDKKRRYITGSTWVMEGSPYSVSDLWDE